MASYKKFISDSFAISALLCFKTHCQKYFPKKLLFYGILKKNHFEKDIFRMENTEDMHVFQKLHKNWIFSCDFVFFDVIQQITFLKKEKNFLRTLVYKNYLLRYLKSFYNYILCFSILGAFEKICHLWFLLKIHIK